MLSIEYFKETKKAVGLSCTIMQQKDNILAESRKLLNPMGYMESRTHKNIKRITIIHEDKECHGTRGKEIVKSTIEILNPNLKFNMTTTHYHSTQITLHNDK